RNPVFGQVGLDSRFAPELCWPRAGPAEGRRRKSRRLGQEELLHVPPLSRPGRPRAATPRLAADGQYRAAESRHRDHPGRAPRRGAASAASAAHRRRRLRAEVRGRRERPRSGQSRRARVLDAAGGHRPGGDAAPLRRARRDPHEDGAGHSPSAARGRRQPAARASRCHARRRAGRARPPVLPAPESLGARATGRSVADRVDPPPSGALAPRRRGLLHAAAGLRRRFATRGLRLGARAWRDRRRVRAPAADAPARGGRRMTDAAPALDLDGLLRRLHLPTVRRLYPELAHRAEGESLAYREFLAVLLAEEVAHRAQTRIQRCVHRAHFPFLKTVDEYDFTFQSGVRLSLLGSALSADFITQGQSLIFSGPSGTGKTHLAIAIAYRAPEHGRHLELRGRSYRTRHAPLDLTPASEPPSPGPARISGNHRPEFSEPTHVAVSSGLGVVDELPRVVPKLPPTFDRDLAV